MFFFFFYKALKKALNRWMLRVLNSYTRRKKSNLWSPIIQIIDHKFSLGRKILMYCQTKQSVVSCYFFCMQHYKLHCSISLMYFHNMPCCQNLNLYYECTTGHVVVCFFTAYLHEIGWRWILSFLLPCFVFVCFFISLLSSHTNIYKLMP